MNTKTIRTSPGSSRCRFHRSPSPDRGTSDSPRSKVDQRTDCRVAAGNSYPNAGTAGKGKPKTSTRQERNSRDHHPNLRPLHRSSRRLRRHSRWRRPRPGRDGQRGHVLVPPRAATGHRRDPERHRPSSGHRDAPPSQLPRRRRVRHRRPVGRLTQDHPPQETPAGPLTTAGCRPRARTPVADRSTGAPPPGS